MNDWINEEAGKIRRERTAAEDKEYLISVSNYWAALRSQIEQDIKAINENAEWHDLFCEIITTENIDFGGIRIKKVSYPGAFGIEVTNGGTEITVKYSYKLDNDSSYERTEKKLTVEMDHGFVVLRPDKVQSFLVPEQASQFILDLVVRAKNDSVKFFADRPYLNR